MGILARTEECGEAKEAHITYLSLGNLWSRTVADKQMLKGDADF